jgi:hypothetical protein
MTFLPERKAFAILGGHHWRKTHVSETPLILTGLLFGDFDILEV